MSMFIIDVIYSWLQSWLLYNVIVIVIVIDYTKKSGSNRNRNHGILK